MSRSRDFGPQADDMRVAFERYSKPELIDLMIHIFRVYVLNSAVQPSLDIDLIHPPAELTRMSFSQLMTHLQTTLDIEELKQFRINGMAVFMRIGEGEFNVAGGTPAAALAAQVAVSDEPLAADPREEDIEPTRDFDYDPEPPRNPVSGTADFEFDDSIDRRVSERTPAAMASSGAPEPEPVVPRRRARNSGRRRGGDSGGGDGDKMNDLFGGGGRSRSGGLNMKPPPPPPPIAEHAEGDLSPEERDRVRGRNMSGGAASEARERVASGSGDKTRRSRPGYQDEGPPPLSGDDKEISASNRFADLDLDFD